MEVQVTWKTDGPVRRIMSSSSAKYQEVRAGEGGGFGRYFKGRGKETTVLANIYRVLVQAVLFFGAETWVLTEKMSQRLEGLHVIFLRQVTRKQAKRRRDGSWRQVPTEEVL